MKNKRILVVDEDRAIHVAVADIFASRHATVRGATSAATALELLQDTPFDLIITATRLPGIGGLDLLHKVREIYPSIAVVLASATPAVEDAVEAMRRGALDYLSKPLCPQRVLQAADKAVSVTSLARSSIIAASQAMQEVLEAARRIATTDATVFISGESGTGKELVAHAIYAQSSRHMRPYVPVNCAAIPDTLIESEFFGHERGAFTGAHARKPGRFETADGGTLLLDEVTEIPLLIQPKLLRVLQEQQFERLGGTQTVSVDVRLIATSNRNLEEAVASGEMREDLYYRLNVIPLHIPPLRERPDDILPLAESFLSEGKRLGPDAIEALLAHPWPGNVRELANMMARAAAFCDGETIDTLPLC